MQYPKRSDVSFTLSRKADSSSGISGIKIICGALFSSSRFASTVPAAIQPAALPITSMIQQDPSSVAMAETSCAISITVVALYLITLPNPGV